MIIKNDHESVELNHSLNMPYIPNHPYQDQAKLMLF